jgi:hypothetical protein
VAVSLSLRKPRDARTHSKRRFKNGAYAGEEAVRRRLTASKPHAERYAEDVMRVWSALAWINMDKFHPKTFSGESRQGRSFHRLGVAIAGAILAIGLALIGAAISRLDLFETLGADTLAVVAGFALVLLGVIAIATYGVIRAIEWVSRER